MFDKMLEADTVPLRLARVFHYCYRTHMSIAWVLAYTLLLYISWGTLSPKSASFFVSIGGILLIVTCLSHSQDLSIYEKARNAAFDLVDAAFSKLGPRQEDLKRQTQEFNSAMARLHRWLYPSRPKEKP